MLTVGETGGGLEPDADAEGGWARRGVSQIDAQAPEGLRGAEVDPEPSMENGGWTGKGRRTRSVRGGSMEREAEKRLHHGGGGVTGRGGAWGETPGEGGGVRMAAAPLPLQPPGSPIFTGLVPSGFFVGYECQERR